MMNISLQPTLRGINGLCWGNLRRGLGYNKQLKSRRWISSSAILFKGINRSGRGDTHSMKQNEYGEGTEWSMHDSEIYQRVKPIKPNDSYVSCTTFDRNGDVVTVSEKYPKMKFLKENGLFPRDFRKIDTSSIEVAPSIMVRPPNAILINFLHIKSIVKKDRVMIFDTSTPDGAAKLGLFMYDMELKLKMPTGSVCYEFKALESILINVMSYLETELTSLTSSCGQILTELENEIDRGKLQDLLIKSKKLSSFHQRTILIKDVLEELLDNDEDLAGMYLSEPKKFDPSVENYEDLELILESYYNQCDEFVQKAGSLLNDIKATEEISNIILDANRNSLMLFELKVTLYTLGFTAATLLPAFYGMNLKNHIESSSYGFGAIVIFSIIQGIIVTAINFKKLNKVQKLSIISPSNIKTHLPQYSSPILQPRRNSWYRRLAYGKRDTKYHHPTSRERDIIWRMINDDKSLK